MKITRNLMARAATVFGLAAVFAVTTATTAEATFQITLTDLTGGVVVVTDEGAGDLAPGVPNTIVFIGSVGNFSIGVESALTNNPGSPTVAFINITGNTIQNVGTGAGGANPNGTLDTLRIEVSADNFTSPIGSPLLLSNSTTGTSTNLPTASLSSFAEGDDNNALYGATSTTPTQTCVYDNLLTGSCTPASAAVTTLFAQAIPFSLTGNTELTIAANSDTAAKTVNYNQSVAATIVPEPATLGLLGTALFGFGVAMRRRNRK